MDASIRTRTSTENLPVAALRAYDVRHTCEVQRSRYFANEDDAQFTARVR